MTARDRLVLARVVAPVVLGAFWVLLVPPERKTVNKPLHRSQHGEALQLATAPRRASNALVPRRSATRRR